MTKTIENYAIGDQGKFSYTSHTFQVLCFSDRGMYVESLETKQRYYTRDCKDWVML